MMLLMNSIWETPVVKDCLAAEGAELGAVWVQPGYYSAGMTGYHLSQSLHGSVVHKPVYVPTCTVGEDVFQSRKRD